MIPLVFEGDWAEVITPPLERYQAERLDCTVIDEHFWERLFTAIRRVLGETPPDKLTRVANLRYRANEYFVGREKELLQIHEELHTVPKAALTRGRVRAVVGMGGQGKTTLVRQYAEKFWKCYPQMFWVDFRANLQQEYANIHDLLFPDRANIGLKDEDKAALALRELNGMSPRLLILDNVEDEESAMNWIPKTGACHTLITSRFTAFSPSVRTMTLFGWRRSRLWSFYSPA